MLRMPMEVFGSLETYAGRKLEQPRPNREAATSGEVNARGTRANHMHADVRLHIDYINKTSLNITSKQRKVRCLCICFLWYS